MLIVEELSYHQAPLVHVDKGSTDVAVILRYPEVDGQEGLIDLSSLLSRVLWLLSAHLILIWFKNAYF